MSAIYHLLLYACIYTKVFYVTVNIFICSLFFYFAIYYRILSFSIQIYFFYNNMYAQIDECIYPHMCFMYMYTNIKTYSFIHVHTIILVIPPLKNMFFLLIFAILNNALVTLSYTHLCRIELQKCGDLGKSISTF